MLTRLVVQLYGVILEISLWVLLLAGVIVGYNLGGYGYGYSFNPGAALISALLGGILAIVVAAMTVGAFLVLDDIRKSVRALEKHIIADDAQSPDQSSQTPESEASSIAAFYRRQGIADSEAATSVEMPSAPVQKPTAPQPHHPVPKAPRPGQKL